MDTRHPLQMQAPIAVGIDCTNAAQLLRHAALELEDLMKQARQGGQILVGLIRHGHFLLSAGHHIHSRNHMGKG
jgi:hypothetical protein